MNTDFLPQTVKDMLAEKGDLAISSMSQEVICHVEWLLRMRDNALNSNELAGLDMAIVDTITKQASVEPQWSVLPPDAPGDWWFYGSWLHHGNPIVNDEIIPGRDVSKVSLVRVDAAGDDNHLIGNMQGRFVSLRPSVAGMEGSGYVGFWMRAAPPSPPLLVVWNAHYGEDTHAE